ncbi:MAG: zinc-dependent metalloprotease [Burkholderiales bacterium]|jgi:hypothetical protein|nr:zinc-dependent metalloprotease [Burkholderiales bacterium]
MFGMRVIAGAVAAALVAGCASTAPSTSKGSEAAAGTPAPAAGSTGSAQRGAGSVQPSGQGAAAPPAAGSQAQAPGAASAAARPPEANALRPFADVVRDAKEAKGFFTVWTKDDRTWLEIRPEQLEQPMFFGNSLASGLGERFFLPGLMGQEHVVVLRRVGNNLQLVARNMRVRAAAGTPLEAAVRESYSDSLLAAAPVVSAPHAERKSFLVDAAVLLGTDLPGAQTALESAFRLSYAFDRANSNIERARTSESGTIVTFRKHFAVPKLPAPPLTPPPPGTPQVPPPQALPDARSLFLSFAYTLAPLPAQPMRPRLADQRVGHFTTAFWDFGNPASGDARTHYVERWRLEKKDPAAELSEPKEPILVWMDKNIPEAHREAVRGGIVEWNKAFERAGFRNAIEVRQQPADADWSTVEGTRHLAVRWFAMQGPGAVAVGPSQSDPRSGEILRGAAIIPENWVRIGTQAVNEWLTRPPAATLSELIEGRQCSYSLDALEQAAFGYELLAARGELRPGSPEAERYIADSLKDVVMHEVGHALGLRHNFKGSTGVKFEQLRDAALARQRGISNSVMDYNALNIALEGEPATVLNQVTLGEYDYWAIEYAYRELTPEREREELARIAGRSSGNPALAYATDEDVIPIAGGAIDPLANQWDLGPDPLAYFKRRFVLSRELWQRTQTRRLTPDESYALLRRNLQRGLSQIGAVTPLVAKYVGGVYTARDLPGASRALLAPVPPAQQREALAVLAREVFAVDSFRFDPDFMSRLGVDHLDRLANPAGPQFNTDFSLANAVLNIQRGALDQVMSDAVAARLADAETKQRDRGSVFTLAEMHRRLYDAIWSELKSGAAIDSLRRNLQREHARRLAAGLVRPAAPVAADVRAVNRQVAMRLKTELQQAQGRSGDAITRAHLSETLALIEQALSAPLTKAL